MAFTFSTDTINSELVLKLGGHLDALTAPQLLPTMDELVSDKPKLIVVDLSELELIDSSGVAVIVALYKRIRAVGGKIRVMGAKDQPLAIFKLLRMDKVFQMA